MPTLSSWQYVSITYKKEPTTTHDISAVTLNNASD